MMTTFRRRFAFLACGMVVVASVMVSSVQSFWQHITQLENMLTGSHLDTFHLASDFQHSLLHLNGAMVRFVVRREPPTWAEFEQASAELDRWIDKQNEPNPKHTTAVEIALLQQIDAAYHTYLAAARRFHTNQQPAMMSGALFAQLEDFEVQAGILHDLGDQLGEAHRDAEKSFLTGAIQELRKLRAFFVAGLVILLALVIGLGWVLYRDLIAPLRTKLVQSAAMLEKQEKLATLGTLAAGIAHEIRNPLTSIKARLYTLDKHLAAPALARKDAEIIGAEITRLERIVQDVLSFARPSEAELKTLSAATLLREVHSLMASSLENRSVQVVLERGLELFVAADPGQLKQVLINLVRNAAEAIDGAGTITLRVRAGHARLDGQMRDVAVLEVADTGKGIPPEVEKRLFDPFFTTKDAGTGLGLSIAARIVEKNGGILQYQTRPGHGTTFGVVLPLAIGNTEPILSAQGKTRPPEA